MASRNAVWRVDPMETYLANLSTQRTKDSRFVSNAQRILTFLSGLDFKPQAIVRPPHTWKGEEVTQEWFDQNVVGNYAWEKKRKHLFFEREQDAAIFKLTFCIS